MILSRYKWMYSALLAFLMTLEMVIAMYGYSLAGFAFRRLAYWIVLVFAIVIAQQYGDARN